MYIEHPTNDCGHTFQSEYIIAAYYTDPEKRCPCCRGLLDGKLTDNIKLKEQIETYMLKHPEIMKEQEQVKQQTTKKQKSKNLKF